MSRPTSQRRPSIPSSNPSSLPARNSYGRSHSQIVTLGAVGASNRVNRRKSSTFSPMANAAALGAAVESGVADGSIAVSRRRSSISKAALGSLNDGSYPPLPSSLPYGHTVPQRGSSSALVDGPPLSSYSDQSKLKMRRASDVSRLSKKERAATGELKCEQCGKAYKHGSCLTKHRWEHTPQWQYTSKLLISKHQQVQLLEAASVLVAMNQDAPPGVDSDDSSSPAASGSSDMRDEGVSSTETTPPPQLDTHRDSKRFSGNSSAYSRSYQSVFSSTSLPTVEPTFSHHRQWSTSSNQRPSTATTSIAESYRDEDPADLAAAVGLLSCSYGTPKTGPTGMPSDVPPVPPLPAKWANYQPHRDPHDTEMDEEEFSDDEGGDQRQRIEEADEGMFGKMD
ncbi:hypothetical protein LTR62_007244 [Meristemomyces frigidus]|uniref:C2H2-type domain-containing protein n=1 Tax=Meristemomyces frigidus TaxID=1508187 RepID=A0AAN7TB76_9PEZI|nr:hypothetical protein LTR62_007244 [Meristemomyces frigidus]